MAKVSYIELAGVKRPAVLSVAAISKIQQEFGGLTEAAENISRLDVMAISRFVEILLDAGDKYCEVMGIERPPKLNCSPAEIMDITEAKGIVDQVMAAVSDSTDRAVEVKSKN